MYLVAASKCTANRDFQWLTINVCGEAEVEDGHIYCGCTLWYVEERRELFDGIEVLKMGPGLLSRSCRLGDDQLRANPA